MRIKLKTPLGELYTGESAETMARLGELLRIRPPLFAAVGDFVSENVIAAGLDPDIVVVDGKTLRIEVPRVEHGMEEVRVTNPPATIRAEAWGALSDAVTLKRRIAIVVEGEEDLLVLPLMAEAPLGSVIVYGQPHEGLVVVTVTAERRRWARSFLEQMEAEE